MHTNQNSPQLIQPEPLSIKRIGGPRLIGFENNYTSPTSRAGKRDGDHMPHLKVLHVNNTEKAAPCTKASILLVDCTPILKYGLTGIINSQPDLSICGHAHPRDAVKRIVNEPVDAVIINLTAPVHLETVKSIVRHCPLVPLVVYSMVGELFAERAIGAGAMGYVSKQQSLDEFPNSLRKLLRCESSDGEPRLDSLSDRELEVFYSVGEGYGTRQIAKNLGVGIQMIKKHKQSIRKKMHLESAHELALAAVKWMETVH